LPFIRKIGEYEANLKVYDNETFGICSKNINNFVFQENVLGLEKINFFQNNSMSINNADTGLDPMPLWDQPSSNVSPETIAVKNNFSVAEKDYSKFRVAVIDSGISHKDSYKNWSIDGEYNMVDNSIEDSVTERVESNQNIGGVIGHGTAIASIISSLSPKVKLIPVKVCGANGSCSGFAVIKGICTIIEEHAKTLKKMGGTRKYDVINVSLSSKFPNKLINDVLNHARKAGISIVLSSGNRGKNCERISYSRFDLSNSSSMLASNPVRFDAPFLNPIQYICHDDRRYPAYDVQDEKDCKSKKIGGVNERNSIPCAIVVGSVSRLGANIGTQQVADGLAIGEISTDGKLIHSSPEGKFINSKFSPSGQRRDGDNGDPLKSWISLVAPGENILALKAGTCFNNSSLICYKSFSGTSFAAPWVTAAIVQLLAREKKSLTPRDLKTKILSMTTQDTSRILSEQPNNFPNGAGLLTFQQNP
jgi:subtilisin family serine protease